MVALYHFWSEPRAQRVRLALGYKGVAYSDHPLGYDDDETFFELGVERRVPVLALDDGRLLVDSLEILWHIDSLFPDGPALVEGCIDAEAWQALCRWRERAEPVLERLYAPARPAYRDIGADAQTLAAYKADVQHQFGMSVEALANDRYDGFEQLAGLTHLRALARYLAEHRFYMGAVSIADAVLAADFYPLQVLDGVTLPVDLMYYLKRVEAACGVDLGEALLVTL